MLPRLSSWEFRSISLRTEKIIDIHVCIVQYKSGIGSNVNHGHLEHPVI